MIYRWLVGSWVIGVMVFDIGGFQVMSYTCLLRVLVSKTTTLAGGTQYMAIFLGSISNFENKF